MVWVWAGLLCGVAEVLIKLGWGLIWPRVLHEPDGMVWMTPISYLTLYLLLGGLCAVLARLAPRLLTLPAVAFVPASLVAWSLARMFARLHEYTVVLLALAVGVAVARMVAAYHARFLWLCRVTFAVMLVSIAVAGATIAMHARRARAARSQPFRHQRGIHPTSY